MKGLITKSKRGGDRLVPACGITSATAAGTRPSPPRQRSTRHWRAVALVLATAVLPLYARAQNWTQWRGPHQDGVASDAQPPLKWSETNNIKWKVKIPGDGTATPLIWGERIFVQTAIPTGKKGESAGTEKSPDASGAPTQDRVRGPGGRRGRGPMSQKPTEVNQFAVLCLDRKDGKVLWQQTAAETVPAEGFRQGDGSFAASSGLTDGQNVYAYFGSQGLYCYDLNGKQKWSKDLGKMRVAMGFGEGSSPALYKQIIVVQWDNEDGSYIAALNKANGKELWKQTREEHTSWATPLIAEYQGKPQVVTSATGKIRSYDLSNGQVLWECGGLTRNVIPSPVADKDFTYCMSGFQGNAAMAIKLGAKGDVTGTDAVIWTLKKSTPYVPSPLLYNGKLWYLSKNDGIISSVDATSGKVFIDAERLESIPNVYASPLGAAGRIYLTGRNGTTVVLKDSDQLEQLAVNPLDDKIDASPVASGKELYLRGRQYLYCIAEK